MTNQEIFNDLGQLGSLIFLGVEMAGADGNFDKSEIDGLVDLYFEFTSEENRSAEHYNNFLEKAVKHRNESFDSFDDRLSYIVNALKHFSEIFNEDVKNIMIKELSSIAMADGELHAQEKGLLNLCREILLGE